MTIWLSYDDGATWSKKKTVYFGFSGYSGMTVVGPDTILLAYNRGRTGGSFVEGDPGIPPFWFAETALARINLRWLESDDPYQFTYYFNEGQPGQAATITGATIQDYGSWDQRARAYASTPAEAPRYAPGVAADTALQLTENSDEVVLSQTEVGAFQFDIDDSFTIEMTINTSDANGVLLGTRTDLKGWSWQVVDGKLQFTITDLVNSATATGAATINDGTWHRIAVVRNADSSGGPKTISLYIDGALSGSPVIDPTSIARDATDPLDAVILGAASNQSAASQLAVTIDTLRITRGVLNPAQFLAISFPTPTRPDAPTYASNAPTSIPGLQFWLPSYDPTRFFGDWGGYADPLPQVPYAGMAARSAIEMSPNAYHLSTYSEVFAILNQNDPTIGNYWQWPTDVVPGVGGVGPPLQVHNSNGTSPTNFDFIQNTGVFTLSSFVRITSETGNYMRLFDNNTATLDLPGFSLARSAGNPFAADRRRHAPDRAPRTDVYHQLARRLLVPHRAGGNGPRQSGDAVFDPRLRHHRQCHAVDHDAARPQRQLSD